MRIPGGVKTDMSCGAPVPAQRAAKQQSRSKVDSVMQLQKNLSRTSVPFSYDADLSENFLENRAEKFSNN